MAEPQKLFAESLMQDQRDASKREIQHTGRSYVLRVLQADGRSAEGFSWSWFSFFEWRQDSREEILTLVFTSRILTITGRHLKGLMDDINDEKCKEIQVLSKTEIAACEEHNRGGKDLKRIVCSAESHPTFDQLLDHLKGEPDES